MNAEPLQVYGDGAAQYIEHAARLEVQAALAQHEGGWRSALRLADDTVLTHPPGLHLITLLATRLSGDSAEASLWTAPLWLLLLALALAWTGKQITGTPRAAYAAFLGTLLLPAAHAAATRVHYDLPMTALLWSAVATLLWGVRSRPILGGLLTAALVILASQIKWTALPFGLFMLGGAWFSAQRATPAPPLRRALTAATLALGTSGVVLLAYLSTAPSSYSAGSLALGESLGGPERLPWYLLSLSTAVFSPLGTLLLAPLLAIWARSARPAGLLITATVIGHLVFLVVMVARPDERFLLTLAPALVLGAALAWSELPTPLRQRVAGAALAVLAIVAVEFHGAPKEIGPAQGTLISQRGIVPSVGLRGAFLADSFERRGWSSRATTPSDRTELREKIWSGLARAGVVQLAVEAGPSDRGDTWWLRYRSRLDQRRGRRTAALIALAPSSVGSARFWWPHPDTVPDSPTHFEPRGFSFDWDLQLPSEDNGDLSPQAALAAAELSPGLLHEFQPRLGLAQVPLPPFSNFHSGWTLTEQLSANDGHTVALFTREPKPGGHSEPTTTRSERAPFDQVLTGSIPRQVFQVRWGHLDEDGRADLATANTDQPNDVYSVLDGELVLRWSSPESDPSQGVAWGDFDGDGDEDLAVANMGAPARLYRNDGGELTLFWSSPTPRNNKDVAWGDVDSDGDLDLLLGGVGPNQLWMNHEGTLSREVILPGSYETDALLLVDLDEDGDLDLISANSAGTPERDQIQRWENGSFGPPVPFGPAQRSSSVAWLPPTAEAPGTLAVSRPNDEDVLVLLGPAANPDWTWDEGSSEPSEAVPVRRLWDSENRGHAREVRSVTLGNAGAQEVLWAVEGEVRLLRRTERSEQFELAWALPQEALTEGIDVGDANGDGLADLAVGNRNPEDDSPGSAGGGAPIQVYLQRPPQTEHPVDTLQLKPGSSFDLLATPNQGAPCPLPQECTSDYLALPEKLTFPNPPLNKPALEERLDRIRAGTVPRTGATDSETLLTPLIRQELGIAPMLRGLQSRSRTVRVSRSWREPSITGYELVFEDPLVGSWRSILLLPDDPPERGSPGLLGVHGHADSPEDFLLGQHGAALARAGLAVLVHEQRASAAGAGEDRVARALFAAGGSLMAVRVYESLVGLEFLRALARVDSERLALVGHSGGSLQNLLTVRLTQGFAAHINDGRAEYASWDEGLIADETLPGLYPHSDSLSRLEAIPTPSLRLGYGYPRGPGPILDFLEKTLGYVSPPSGGPAFSGQPPNSP